MNIIDLVEQEQIKKDVPEFSPGDTVKVHLKVIEGERERVQVFEGIVIGRKGGGVRETFTVRKMTFGISVERVFPVHSPRIVKVEIVTFGRVRRAKLYYLREKIGKKSRVKTRILARSAKKDSSKSSK